MIRAMFVAVTLAAVCAFTSAAAVADDHGHHHGGYSCGGYSNQSHGFVQFGYGNPYASAYYARPVYPAYGYGYYQPYPVYRPYYGGCGGYGYPAYGGYNGFSIGFGF